MTSRYILPSAFLAAMAMATPVASQVAPEARIHPEIPFLDANGGNVLRTGGPVSPGTTCGSCHDVDFITTHTVHQGSGWAASATPALATSSRPRDPSPADEAEMNCFLCHTPNPANRERLEALEEGQGPWAATATLATTGIVRRSGSGWVWNPDAFGRDGRVRGDLVALQGPETGNCAQCHGIAGDDLDDPVTFFGLNAGDWQTVSRGEVISPQRISQSGVNVRGKTDLTRSWDVHAERLMECANCHFSQNNPIYRKESPTTQPKGLIFDSRRMPLGAYLQRPDHNFAGQSTGPEETQTSQSLACTSCHDPGPTHQWLPYAKRHTDALACETCHTPTLHAVAVQSVDWSRLDENSDPAVTWRGCESGCETTATDMVEGVEPALLLRQDPDGRARLAPYNLVTSWYWVQGPEGAPVPLHQVREASAGTEDRDRIQARLVDLGVDRPTLKAEIRPYAIHHSITGGEWATRQCSTCHDKDSRLSRTVVLGPRPPSGDLPTVEVGSAASLAGAVLMDGDGALVYEPEPASAGLYVLAHDFVWWSNLLGMAALVGAIFGVVIHGGLRWRAVGSQPPGHHPETAPVYMYRAYQRAWHWLQALAIVLLLATGVEVHVLRLGVMDFATAVRVHNVVGFIVLANAIFAALFHLASGEIRQYMPQPVGFFGGAITQARYYLSGIFKGEPHPFEKSPTQKLNPLQQVTYLVILNVLLPLQVVTGVLIWGAQRWPAVDATLGGLVFLAPLHALGAWMFAAFLVVHMYLTTTGPTPTANIRAMVVGWEAPHR